MVTFRYLQTIIAPTCDRRLLSLLPLACLLLLAWPARLAAQAKTNDTLLILPFENVSGRAEYNWVGESFVVLYADLLNAPGLRVITPDERLLVYEKVGLQINALLTRATGIKLAEAAQANLALVGTYDIGSDPQAATIAISARLIDAREGRLIPNKVFNFSGPLTDLQLWQGQLAWHILYERNPGLPYSKDQLVRTARSVPARAYESYVKGIQTQDAKLRESFLRRAVQEYGDGGEQRHYGQAIFELGMLQYRQRNFTEAVTHFKELTRADPHYFQALFYLGQAAYQANNLNEAAAALEKLAEAVPLPEVLNNAGAVSLAKGDLPRAVNLLHRAALGATNEAAYQFNYGYALWRNKNFAEAAQQLRNAINLNANDGEAHFLLAKSLEASGQAAEAARIDDQAKRLLSNYAKWTVAPDKMPLLIRLKNDFNRVEFLKLERQQQQQSAPKTAIVTVPPITPPPLAPAPPPAAAKPAETAPTIVTTAPATVATAPPAVTLPKAAPPKNHLEHARQLFTANQDAEALIELNQIIAADATAAEAHYLRGLLLQRRNDMEGALSSLQSAVYWNPRLVPAHVVLGRLYLARGDRALALTHVRQAMQIDPKDRGAIALKQQLETGR